MTVHEKKKKIPTDELFTEELGEELYRTTWWVLWTDRQKTKGNTCRTQLSLIALGEVSYQKYNNFFFNLKWFLIQYCQNECKMIFLGYD